LFLHKNLFFFFVLIPMLTAGNGIESETRPDTVANGQDLLKDEIVSEHLTRYLLISNEIVVSEDLVLC